MTIRMSVLGCMLAIATLAVAVTSTSAARGERIPIESTVQSVRIGDVGPPGASVGDTRSEVLFLWNREITPTPIGNAHLLCTVLGRGGIYGSRAVSMCDGIYNMPLGKLLVRGLRRSSRFYILQITGGTRRYAGAQASSRSDPAARAS